MFPESFAIYRSLPTTGNIKNQRNCLSAFLFNWSKRRCQGFIAAAVISGLMMMLLSHVLPSYGGWEEGLTLKFARPSAYYVHKLVVAQNQVDNPSDLVHSKFTVTKIPSTQKDSTVDDTIMDSSTVNATPANGFNSTLFSKTYFLLHPLGNGTYPEGSYKSHSTSSASKSNAVTLQQIYSGYVQNGDSALGAVQTILNTEVPTKKMEPVPRIALAHAENETVCKFPHLTVDDPSVRKYIKNYKPLKCSEMKNWVYSAKGLFLLHKEAVDKYSPINCTYIHISRDGDNTYKETVYPSFKNGSALLGDVFRVECVGSRGHNYSNLHVGVKKVPALLNRKLNMQTPKLNMDVLVYLIDSISNVNFLRKLPKFYKVITEDMGATIMEGFNIVGDGTPWSLIPIITGHFQTEMYEARKRFDNASYLDGWPLNFKAFKNAGYVTSFAEEQPKYSFFNYKLKGFKDPPVDHYLRSYELAVSAVMKQHLPYCLGDTPRSLTLCKYFRDQQDIYKVRNTRTFSMLFSSETSHDDYNYVQVLDEHWAKEFGELYRDGYFHNTIVVIMGDHGRRFGPIRQTQTGKIEEKLPFFALFLPQEFRKKYTKSYENVLINSKRLFTPFDIHETLNDVINWPGDGGIGNLACRGISLFREIPAERSCSDAAIKPHFCSCLEWEDLSPQDSTVIGAAVYVIGQFNEELRAAGELCAPLTLRTIISARKLHPNHALLAFKQSQDYDNINPDLSANATVFSVLIQIRFTVHPNGADYEVSVNHFLDLAKFVVSLDDVSRLNMYGNQPHCIMQTHQQLRQYCFCKDLLTTPEQPE